MDRIIDFNYTKSDYYGKLELLLIGITEKNKRFPIIVMDNQTNLRDNDILILIKWFHKELLSNNITLEKFRYYYAMIYNLWSISKSNELNELISEEINLINIINLGVKEIKNPYYIIDLEKMDRKELIKQKIKQP